MVLLTLWLLAAQDYEALLDRLKSPAVEERDGAQKELTARGREALPYLKKRENDPDPECRGRVRDTIAEIERIERIRPVRPAEVRVTVDLKDVPLVEALEKVYQPFGLRLSKPPIQAKQFKDRRVTLRLKEASLWRAHETLQTASGAAIDLDGFGVRILHPWVPNMPEPVVEAENVRLRLRVDSQEASNPDADLRVSLLAELPVGSAPLSWDVEDFHLTDDREKEIQVRIDRVNERRGSVLLRRKAHEIVRGEAWQGSVSPADLKGAREVRFSGKFVLKYPHDLERNAIDVRKGEGPFSKEINGIACAFRVHRDPEGLISSITQDFVDTGKGTPREYLLWVEDDGGRWLSDVFATAIGGRVQGGVRGGPQVDDPTRIATLVITGFLGEDRVTIPFDFKNVAAKVPSK